MHLDDVPVVGAIAAATGAIVGGIVKIFGSRAERAKADLDTADLALRIADRADEQTARHKHALGTCEEQLRAMRDAQADDRQRIARLEDGLAEHARCGPRIASLERVVERLTMQSTPPLGIHPDELRAAMAAEETGP